MLNLRCEVVLYWITIDDVFTAEVHDLLGYAAD